MAGWGWGGGRALSRHRGRICRENNGPNYATLRRVYGAAPKGEKSARSIVGFPPDAARLYIRTITFPALTPAFTSLAITPMEGISP